MMRLLATLFALGLAQPALAEPAETARTAALQLLDAVEGLAVARTARDQVTALTRTIAAHETGLEALRIGLREVTLRESVIAQLFDAQSDSVARLLSAMMAVQRVEGPALLLHPAGPLGTARAGMLIADLTPAMQAEVDRMAILLTELRELRSLRGDAMQTLSVALTSLQDARAELSQAIAERRTPPPPIGEDEARLLDLLASAQTLEVLSAGLSAIPPFDAAGGPSGFAQTRGQLPLPARATVLRRAGEADAAGTVRPGLVLATEPGALVTAPWDGTLRYRGPLLDYGNVILLEPDEGYLILIAGLETVYPRPGEIVVAGGPLGLMPGGVDPGTEFAAQPDASAGRSLSLYVELRHRGQAIDPGDWFDLTATMP